MANCRSFCEMVTSSAAGVVISVRVIPRAGRSAIDGMRGDALLVRLKAPPVDGAANAELIRVIAEALDVPARNVSITGGEHARQKRVLVTGIDRARVEACLGVRQT
jgi:uncharacterized protein (TIGR00251 family)